MILSNVTALVTPVFMLVSSICIYKVELGSNFEPDPT